MLNIIWAAMIAASFLVSFINGSYDSVMSECTLAAKNSVNTLISLGGIMCFWTGFLKIAESCGAVGILKKLLLPLMRFLFPKASGDDEALSAMLSNMCANILGMGNAATPFGVSAMRRLDELNGKKTGASADMCTFAVMNTASFQLIPTTIIALRGGNTDVVVPIWICSLAALIMGLLATRLFGGDKNE